MRYSDLISVHAAVNKLLVVRGIRSHLLAGMQSTPPQPMVFGQFVATGDDALALLSVMEVETRSMESLAREVLVCAGVDMEDEPPPSNTAEQHVDEPVPGEEEHVDEDRLTPAEERRIEAVFARAAEQEAAAGAGKKIGPDVA